MNRYDIRLMAIVALSCTGIGYGLTTMEIGPDSVRGHPTTEQPGWPAGLVELPRHESRTYSVWGTGGEAFYFKADPDQISELILLFSETRMRDHQLWIKDSKSRPKSFGGTFEYNVMLRVTDWLPLRAAEEAETARTYEPTLTLYVDLPADKALAARIKVPDNIIVNNEVAGFPLKGKVTEPKRENWYARVQFDDSTPAVDFKHCVSTRVTFWEKGIDNGIPLGNVGHDDSFQVALSEKEITDIESGRSWLTLTVGNWASKPKSDHPRLNRGSLSREKEKTQPVTIPRPRLFHGRILYEDGAPVTPKSFMGRGLRVTFPFVGSVQVEADGYISVCFAEDQYESLQESEGRKNIYVPSDEKWNQSTARFVFPVSRLSQDKSKAGEVRIPRPASSQPAR